MSEDIAQSNGLLVELVRVRTERDLLRSALHQVEAALTTTRADVAQLRTAALDYVTSATYEERARLRAELYVLATVEHPGVVLLRELEAARKVAKAMRQIDRHVIGAYETDSGSVEPCEECGEMREIAAQALAAYDEAMKGGTP